MRLAVFTAILVASPALANTAVIVVGDGATVAELDRVETEVRDGAGMQLQAADVTRARIGGMLVKGGACDVRTVDCLVQLGVVCGSEQMLLVDVGQQGGTRSVALTIVDVNAGKAKKRARAATVAGAIAGLSRASASTTRVAFTGPAGTTVAVDGADAAALPFTRTDLAPGPHTLVVKSPGKEAREQEIDVLLGEDTKVAIEEVAGAGTPQATAPGERATSIMPWVGVAGGAIVVVVGGVLGGLGAVSWSAREAAAAQVNAREDQLGADPTLIDDKAFRDGVTADRQAFDSADAEWTAAGQPLLTVGALVAGVGAGALLMSTMWALE